EIFEPYLTRTGFWWAVLFQPIAHGFATAGAKNGGNPLTTPWRIVLLGSAFWSDPADDEIIQEKVHELRRWAERTARDRGLLHPFIYMNYASDAQDVMGGVGTENLRKMRRVKSLYDPENRLGAYWKGGFKL
ncbi:hypothetical protein FB451DRAFT_1063217, partial [Mycena latifolia]